eukprot:TRINITY_DN2352_c0_g1_i1.p1 TRINITY_DN2352_c0_g1~~TRINITY_DN2352_c0_g1_i1.p1  ORF type:complete len:200 (+),score=48.79 TRINITY_DN2352_c0_g1_i1:50-649(+)
MGNEKSCMGLKMMEAIYPVPGGKSVFDGDEKLSLLLQKEVQKKALHIDDLASDVEIVDGDMDSEIDRCLQTVWGVYLAMDKKQAGQLNKKIGERFFQDCLELYAMRQNKKYKDVLAKGVDYKKATAASFKRMSANGNTVSQKEFTEFLNLYDIEEVLSEYLLTPPEIDINTNVQFVDITQFSNTQREGPKLVYREYPDD